MSYSEPILISVSIVVAAPVSEHIPDNTSPDPLWEPFLDDVSTRLGASVAPLKAEPWFVQDAGFTYHYLNEENAGRCARCGRWTTDYERPEPLRLLMYGRSVDVNAGRKMALAPFR